MLPKLLEVPINTYLMVLAKIRRPSATPSAGGRSVFLQQDDVGRVLGDVGGRVDGDAHVGRVQSQCIIDPVTQEGHAAVAAPLRVHDPRLRFGTHARENGGPGDRLSQLCVVQGVDLAAGHRAPRR